MQGGYGDLKKRKHHSYIFSPQSSKDQWYRSLQKAYAVFDLLSIEVYMGIFERRQREKEQRRNDIIMAAKSVFGEKGYKRATIGQIAREVQLSPGTLYLYFKNKEELYTILSVGMLKSMTEEIKNATRNKSMSSNGKLTALKKIFMKIYKNDATILMNLFSVQSSGALNRLSPELIEQTKDIFDATHNSIAAIIQEGSEQGVFREVNPVPIADIIWSIFSGLVLWSESKRQLNHQKAFGKQTLELAFNILYEGMCKKNKENQAREVFYRNPA